MSRRALPALLGSVLACLALPSMAGAVTVSQDTQINCSTGQAPAGFNWDSGQKAFTIKDGLTVPTGVTLAATHSGANPERCRLFVQTGKVAVNGTIDYDQRGNMERGGPLELLAQDTITIAGEVGSDGQNGTSPGVPLGGDGRSGTDAGTVLIRGTSVTISGTVSADGGKGGNGAAIPLIGSANGGNGGDAGSVTVISDFGPLANTGSITANPGAGGTNAGSGTNGDAGSNNGLIRRNALSFSGNGQVIAANHRTNGPPTNLASTSPATAGTHIALAWKDNSDEETGFVITKSTGSGAFEAIGSVAQNVTSFTDPTAFAGGQTYRYIVLPAFPSEIWPGALVASNLLTAAIPAGSAATTTPTSTNPTQGTTQPSSSSSAAITISRSLLHSTYSIRRGNRNLRVTVRSSGRGRLRASIRVRTSRGTRTGSRSLSIRGGRKSFNLTLPRGWRPGRYTLRLTSTSATGRTKTVTKRIRLKYKR